MKKELEALVQRCSIKKKVLEISRSSQEYTCARVLIRAGAGERVGKK